MNSILPPEGFTRITVAPGSFAEWIRNLPLKPQGSPVNDYRGRIYKTSEDTTVAAVVKCDIKGKRLEQCMDILIRFYSEYLWENKQYDKILFPLPGGYLLKWQDWMDGYRPEFKGINVSLNKTADFDSSGSNFEKYLWTVFAESHTQQFYYAYKTIDRINIKAGDFIVKRKKGHAVLIADLAKNESGEMVALVGHGDTPACQFYILDYKKGSPWIPLDFTKDSIPLPIKRKMTWDGLRRFSDLK